MLPVALPARHFGVLLLESLVVNLPEQPFMLQFPVREHIQDLTFTRLLFFANFHRPA